MNALRTLLAYVAACAASSAVLTLAGFSIALQDFGLDANAADSAMYVWGFLFAASLLIFAAPCALMVLVVRTARGPRPLSDIIAGVILALGAAVLLSEFFIAYVLESGGRPGWYGVFATAGATGGAVYGLMRVRS